MKKNTYHFSLMSDTQNEHCTRCGLHLSVETFKPTDFTESMIHQCFCQTVPLRESRISEKAPRKMEKGPIQPFTFQGCMQAQPRHSLIAIPRLKIATDMVANELTFYNATSISFSVTKNSGLVVIITTSCLNVEDQ